MPNIQVKPVPGSAAAEPPPPTQPIAAVHPTHPAIAKKPNVKGRKGGAKQAPAKSPPTETTLIPPNFDPFGVSPSLGPPLTSQQGMEINKRATESECIAFLSLCVDAPSSNQYRIDFARCSGESLGPWRGSLIKRRWRRRRLRRRHKQSVR